jgi:hypothetical protein
MIGFNGNEGVWTHTHLLSHIHRHEKPYILKELNFSQDGPTRITTGKK